MNKIKINDNKQKKIIISIIISLVSIIIIVSIFRIIITLQAKKSVVTVYAEKNPKQNEEIEWFAEDEKIDINDIINQNLNNQEKDQIETEVVALEYETEYQNNDKLPKGMVKVLQQGQDGEQQLIIKKKYAGDTVVSDEQIGRKIVTPCINKIVEVGTASKYSNYKIKVGDTVYSTPYTLAIREEDKKDAEVLISVNQDSKLKVLKKSNSWYYVKDGKLYAYIE